MVAEWGRRLADLTGGQHDWLFGRWTDEQLLTHWNKQGDPFKDPLNDIPEYVASSNPKTTLEWPNSTPLDGDVPAAVQDLKQGSSATGAQE